MDDICVGIVWYNHYPINPFRIASRRDEVIERRQKVKGLAFERARTLQASLAWQQFRRDADEVRRAGGGGEVCVTSHDGETHVLLIYGDNMS